MILRLAAVAALLFGVALLATFVHALERGPFVSPAGRHQRAMKDRTAEPASYEAFSFADLGALPRDLPIPEYARIERRAVTVECYVQRMFRALDGDYHLDIAPVPGSAAGRQHYYAAAEITPQWHRDAPAWRFEALAARFRPLWDAGAWDRPPQRARLSGWLMYEYEHSVVPGGKYPPLISAWEVHPVTRIEVWDDARGAFEELSR